MWKFGASANLQISQWHTHTHTSTSHTLPPTSRLKTCRCLKAKFLRRPCRRPLLSLFHAGSCRFLLVPSLYWSFLMCKHVLLPLAHIKSTKSATGFLGVPGIPADKQELCQRRWSSHHLQRGKRKRGDVHSGSTWPVRRVAFLWFARQERFLLQTQTVAAAISSSDFSVSRLFFLPRPLLFNPRFSCL